MCIRDRVKDYVAFLQHNALRKDEPSVWLWQLNGLLRLTRQLTDEEKSDLEKAQKYGIRVPGLPVDRPAAILEAMASSTDHVVAAYALLEKVAPKSFGDWRASL